jgi:hypothetical protein
MELALEFLGRAAAWLGAVIVLAAAVTAAAWSLARAAGRDRSWRRTTLWAVLGALLAASLVDRFGVPNAWRLEIWKRDLPVVWAAAGAALGAAGAVLLPLRNKEPGAP